jgi:predicted ATPase
MLTEILGREPAPEVQAELLRLSGGNPFALEELAGAVVESGWLDPATGRRLGTGAVTVPWTLAESIRARAARLAAPEREMLEWAAAAGDRFDIRLIARASGAAPPEARRLSS